MPVTKKEAATPSTNTTHKITLSLTVVAIVDQIRQDESSPWTAVVEVGGNRDRRKCIGVFQTEQQARAAVGAYVESLSAQIAN
jgi:hypothetical protein